MPFFFGGGGVIFVGGGVGVGGSLCSCLGFVLCKVFSVGSVETVNGFHIGDSVSFFCRQWQLF